MNETLRVVYLFTEGFVSKFEYELSSIVLF